MIRSFDFPHEAPFCGGSKTVYWHIDFDDFGFLDDDDALYYADSILNFRLYPTAVGLDAWDFIRKYPMQILKSVHTNFNLPCFDD